jgi:hypothetical protein
MICPEPPAVSSSVVVAALSVSALPAVIFPLLAVVVPRSTVVALTLASVGMLDRLYEAVRFKSNRVRAMELELSVVGVELSCK